MAAIPPEAIMKRKKIMANIAKVLVLHAEDQSASRFAQDDGNVPGEPVFQVTIHSHREDVSNNHHSEEDCDVCCQRNNLRLGPKLQHRNGSCDFRGYYHYPFEPEVGSTVVSA